MSSEAGSPNRYRISLFGGPLLQVRGSPRGISPLQGAILGTVYGGPLPQITREEVISLLWPDETPSVARRRLNQLLYSFKKKTGNPPPFVLEGEEIHCLDCSAAWDVQDFMESLESGHLSKCVDYLALGFLRRVDGHVTREFSDWIRNRESHFRSLLKKRGQVLLATGEESGHWSVARDAAEALLSLDPNDERSLLALLKARGSIGGIRDAESSMEDFAKSWLARKGRVWEPSEETLAFLERLRSRRSFRQSRTLPDPGSGVRQPPLVGREKELKLLRRALYTPPHQALRGLLVSGEGGIGKTRLINDALSGIDLEGQRVFWANLSELERLIPLNPFIEAFREDRAGDTLQTLDEPWKTVLFGVMPHHFRGTGPIPHAPEIQPGSVPRRLFEAVDQFLTKLVELEPTILIIEDIQWADETTLAVLEFLLRRWDRGRLQIVLSVRSEEVNRKSALRNFLEAFRIHSDHTDVHLEDLEHLPSQQLIQSLSDRPLHQEEVTYLQSLAGGNPFFLIELTLEYLAGRVDKPVLPASSFSIPLSIKQVLRRRLSQLSQESERILNAVAVHTHSISVQDLSRITGIPPEASIDGLDQLHQFRLIRSEGTRIAPGHELIRQTVYQELNPSERAWLHEKVARLLQEGKESPPPDELAVHFDKAGVAEEALFYATEAADRAEESGAIAEALQFLKIAREHTTEPREVADLLGRMGHLHYLHQNMEEAAPLLETAAKRKRAQNELSAALRWELEWADALAKTEFLPLRECLEEISRIKKEALQEKEYTTLVMALDKELHLYDHPDYMEKARSTIEEASQYTFLDNLEVRCRAEAIVALNLYFGDPQVGLSAARRAVKIAMETESHDLQLLALNRLMVVLLYQGMLRTPEGDLVFEAIAGRFGSTGDLMLKFFAKLNRAVWHLEIGELQKAQRWFLDAEKVVWGTKAKEASLRLLINRGELHFHLGEPLRAQSDFTQASESLTPSARKQFEPIIQCGLGLCALHAGNLTAARTIEANLPEIPKNWTFDPSIIAAFKAEMFRMRGDSRAGDQFLAITAESVRDRFVTAWLKLMLRRARQQSRTSLVRARELAQEGYEVAEELHLAVRAREFRQIIESSS